MCYLDRGGLLRDSYATRGFHTIFYSSFIKAYNRSQIAIVVASVEATILAVVLKGQKLASKCKIKLNGCLKPDQRRSLRDIGASSGFYDRTFWYCSRNKLNHFSHSLQIEKTMSGTDKKIKVTSAQLCTKKVLDHLTFLICTVFFDEFSLSLKEALKKEIYRIWGSQRAEIVCEDPKSSPGFLFLCAISKNQKIDPYSSDGGSVAGDSCKTMFGFHLFLNIASDPTDMIFEQDRDPPAQEISGNTFLSQKI